jgi:hypothetical protein
MRLTKINERFAKFAPPLFLSSQDIYSQDTVANHLIGTMAYATEGRIFRYALVGGSSLVVGNLLQQAVEDTQFENMAVTASAQVLPQNGLQLVNITNGTTTVVPAAYLGGHLGVYTAGGEALGYDYDILGITGTLTSGGALVVTVDHPVSAAWTTSLKVVMSKSPWSGVIQAPATTQTGIAVGVATYPITNAYYGWVQSHGPASVLSDGSTFAVGSDVGTPSGTAGCVTVFAAGTTHQRVGVVRMAAASGHCIPIFLQID